MDLNQSFEETRDSIKGIIQHPAGIKHIAELTSAEIAMLWDSYVYYSMMKCIFKYYEKVAQEHYNNVEQFISDVLKSFDRRLKWITDTFNRENLKLPTGFSHNDVNLDAP